MIPSTLSLDYPLDHFLLAPNLLRQAWQAYTLIFLGQTVSMPPRLFILKTFRRILTLILTNYIIHLKDKRFFHQIKGTAMGCCISVYFSNCYMFVVTRPLVLTPPTWLICFLDLLTICSLLFVNRTNRIFLTRLKIFIIKLYDMKSSTQQTHKIFLTPLSP